MRSRNKHRSWLEENYMISLNVCVASYQLHISCHTNDLFANTTYWTNLHNKHPEWCTPEIPKIVHRKFFITLAIWLIILLRNLRYIDCLLLKWIKWLNRDLILLIQINYFYCSNIKFMWSIFFQYSFFILQCFQRATNLFTK